MAGKSQLGKIRESIKCSSNNYRQTDGQTAKQSSGLLFINLFFCIRCYGDFLIVSTAQKSSERTFPSTKTVKFARRNTRQEPSVYNAH